MYVLFFEYGLGYAMINEDKLKKERKSDEGIVNEKSNESNVYVK